MDNPELTQREIVLQAMRARPHDPWPRAEGHVVFGVPGSPRSQKAYHEPGGSFSPSPGSFGISFWIVDQQGNRIATSDDIPLPDIEQHYDWTGTATIPAIATTTPHYDCRWAARGDGRWEGCLRIKASAGRWGVVLVRSVGPAGGPIEDLAWDGHQLIINHRWVVELSPWPESVCLGAEGETGWATAAPGAPAWVDSGGGGWGYARFDLGDLTRVRLTIRDTAPQFHSPLTFRGTSATVKMDLPDKAFVASLDAQVANLMMAFIGKQTCPGEPTNYPLAWERDGAYAVMAMARAGQVDAAKDLVVHFAENDFFGGFGAEGDAPGSAINALVGVALIADDTDFRAYIWPHVERKAALIREMLGATSTIRKTWTGPIVPEHAGKPGLPIICEAAKDGLIVGSMDLHFPVLYVTAMSYRGLRQAARLADALGHSGGAREYAELAEKIRGAWLANFAKPELNNERTFMSALWPTWIVDPRSGPYRAGLERRWEKEHHGGQYPQRPLWTYFTIAEAHQWLFLGRPDIVWQTLRYFRDNQCSPGLYTWWEGAREENAFGLWQHIRGWVAPHHVTPHYWTAAEMLLLQLDMLAYVDESGSEPVIVVGAGVPPEWLAQPMAVEGLPTAVGVVDWSYDKRKLKVTLHGARECRVRSGPSFTGDVEIRYL